MRKIEDSVDLHRRVSCARVGWRFRTSCSSWFLTRRTSSSSVAPRVRNMESTSSARDKRRRVLAMMRTKKEYLPHGPHFQRHRHAHKVRECVLFASASFLLFVSSPCTDMHTRTTGLEAERFVALRKRERICFSDSPAQLESMSAGEAVRSCARSRSAALRTIADFPVPGGPKRRMDRVGFAPRWWRRGAALMANVRAECIAARALSTPGPRPRQSA
jgi:hypothetical protein